MTLPAWTPLRNPPSHMKKKKRTNDVASRQRKNRAERYRIEQEMNADEASWRCENCSKKAEQTDDEKKKPICFRRIASIA